METTDWEKRYGLSGPAASQVTAQLAALPEREQAGELLARLLERLDRPGRAALAEPLAAAGLVRLAYAAPFLIRHLLRHPGGLGEGLLRELAAPGALLPWGDYCAPGGPAGLEDEALMRRLRIWKYDNYVRITARELLAESTTAHTCALLSGLADTMIRAAYRHAFQRLVERHGLPVREDGQVALGAVIGMGKLGGEELNYASDVDLIFIHDGDDTPCLPMEAAATPPDPAAGEEAYWEQWRAPAAAKTGAKPGAPDGAVSSGEFHNQLARQVTRILGANTEDGIGFRVDVDLRPQGRSGLLAPSLAFLRQYYDVHGREWERTAMLKARPVAGAPRVGEQFGELIRPFVYRRYLDYGAVEGIAIVKHDIDRHHHAALENNLKLGAGGIRENEFFVQALQLLYGGKQPALRVTSHEAATRRLAEAGIFPAGEADAHLRDYWLMRRVENRLQMQNEAQTHELPDDEQARRRIFTDFEPDFAQRRPQAEAALAQARERTALRFRQLFEQLGREEYPGPELWRQAVREHCPADACEGALERIDGLLNRLMATRLGERCVFKVARLLTRPEIYRTGTEAAFPRWLDFLDQIGNRNTIHALIEANPAIVSWASAIFAEGGLHASQLVRHPEFVESFIAGEGGEGGGGMLESLAGIAENARDEEGFLLELQMARSQALIRILTAYLEAPDETAHRALLSDLAEATVDICMRYAWRIVVARQGLPEGAASPGQVSGFAVLAMGKLGSREMRFGSDLDLVFVYGEEGTTSEGRSHYEFYTRLAQKMGTLLTAPTQFGKLYEIDHRLRPFGGKSVLVPTLSGFLAFVQEAEVWNFQAFSRMRFLCGESAPAESLIAAVAQAWGGRPLPDREVARAVWDMLGRLVAEHAPPGSAKGERLPLKYAMGGMIGFEFLSQLLFLLAPRRREGSWGGGPEPEKIRELRPAYDSISALDERLSFYEPRFHHEVTPEHFGSLAAIGGKWNYRDMRALCAGLKAEVEQAFQEAMQ